MRPERASRLAAVFTALFVAISCSATSGAPEPGSLSRAWRDFQATRNARVVTSGASVTPSSWLDAIHPGDEWASAREVIDVQLLAMQGGDISAASALWERFSQPDFHLAGIEPWGRHELAEAVLDSASQYGLLRDSRLHVIFPSEEVELIDPATGEGTCWHEVHLELRVHGIEDEGFTAAKLGWECSNLGDGQGWRNSAVTWHDFRPDFRPGIGQEEWPRICG